MGVQPRADPCRSGEAAVYGRGPPARASRRPELNAGAAHHAEPCSSLVGAGALIAGRCAELPVSPATVLAFARVVRAAKPGLLKWTHETDWQPRANGLVGVVQGRV
jgi:hypothetical protein